MDAQLSSECNHANIIKNLTKEEMRKVHTLLMKKMYHEDEEYNQKYKQYQKTYREKKSQDEEYRKKTCQASLRIPKAKVC
jgi:DNA-directed RNA polymerase